MSAAWLLCCRLPWRRYQRWMVTAAWFTCWMNLHTQSSCCENGNAVGQRSTAQAAQRPDLSASSSVTSLLREGAGLTEDWWLEDVEEKFFCDLVRELLSWDTSSLAVAFRMLLEEKNKTLQRTTVTAVRSPVRGRVRTYLKDGLWLELLGVRGFSE